MAFAARAEARGTSSGSRRPSTQSATYSPSAGPCLKPWPEPPPSEPPVRPLGVAVRRGSACPAVRSYWQTRAPTIGAPASAGNRRATYSRASCSFAGSGSRSSWSGSISRPGPSGATFEPEPAELAVAVEGPVVVAEAGVPAHVPSTPTKKTSRREIRCSTSPGKSPRQPRRRRPRRRRRRAAGRPGSTRRPRRGDRVRASASPAARSSTPASGSNRTDRRSSPPSDG